MLATLASAMLITGLFRFAILRGEFLLLLPKTNPAVIFLAGDILPGLPRAGRADDRDARRHLAAAALHGGRAASSTRWATTSRPPA